MDTPIGAKPNLDRKRAVLLVQITHWLTTHWLAAFLMVFGIYNFLPFVAPIAMRLGYTAVGGVIYNVYSTQCHQMAQRSFFLFGTKPMYDLDKLPLTLTGNIPNDTLALRDFRGDDVLGWKVAWSDRMVYMYGSLWVATAVYWLISQRRFVKPSRLWVFVLLLTPLAFDGITHLLSDMNGLMSGFRYNNAWLAVLTSNAFPANFYLGDAIGSFNSLIGLMSGVFFGIGITGLVIPFADREMKRTSATLSHKLNRHYSRGLSLLQENISSNLT